MSRFFEALKEVSRSQLVPNGTNGPTNGQEASEPKNSLIVDLPELTEPAVPMETLQVELPPVELFEAMDPLAAAASAPAPADSPADYFDSFVPRQSDFRPRQIEIKLEKNVPLMPHTLDHTIVEQYRRLRTKIQQQHATKPIQSLLVASPSPGEGKTVTAMNLGLSFAMLPSFKVLLIDGDLRKSTVGKWLGADHLPGLSNLIDGSAKAEEIICKSDEFPLYFVLGGTSKRPAAELLTSPLLGQFIRRMTQHFDLVLVDSPPVNLIADAQMLAGSCDGVLLVAKAFSTTNKSFQKMLHDLMPFRIVGTVLNGGMRTRPYHRYYKY